MPEDCFPIDPVENACADQYTEEVARLNHFDELRDAGVHVELVRGPKAVGRDVVLKHGEALKRLAE